MFLLAYAHAWLLLRKYSGQEAWQGAPQRWAEKASINETFWGCATFNVGHSERRKLVLLPLFKGTTRNSLTPGTLYLYTLCQLRCIHKCNHLTTLSSSTPTNRTMLWLQWSQVASSQTKHVAVTHKICQIMSIRYVKFQWHQKDTDTHHSYYILCSETTKQLAASHISNSSPWTQLALHTIRQDSCRACPLLAKQLFDLGIPLTSQYKISHLEEVLTAPLPDTDVDLQNSRHS